MYVINNSTYLIFNLSQQVFSTCSKLELDLVIIPIL